MALLEGKSPTEKKKIIAAGILGLVALVALYLAFGRSSGTTASTKDAPKPKPTASSSGQGDVVMPGLAAKSGLRIDPDQLRSRQLVCSGAGSKYICVLRAAAALPW